MSETNPINSYMREWRAKNPEKSRKYSAMWKAKNPAHCREYGVKWRRANPEKVAQWEKNRKRNLSPEKLKIRQARAYVLKQSRIPSRIRGGLSSRLYAAVSRAESRKASTTLSLIGCSLDQLLGYLELNFAPGMNWENYGKWHIDHILPCAKFDLTNPEQQRECFHYKNLQPLWAAENFSKGARIYGIR